MDLLNEVLNMDFGQGAAKISEVKVGVRKKSARAAGPQVHWSRIGHIGRYFFQPPTLTSDIFAASWPTRTFSTSF